MKRSRRRTPGPVEAHRLREHRSLGRVASLALLGGAVGLHLALVAAIREGHGGDFYVTGYGIQTTPISALIALVLFDTIWLAIFLAAFVRARLRHRARVGGSGAVP